ncbi:hypothetical protein CEXT_216121 [Caerostris extrusa]|uniref:Uncharacterized protein n=1 Tax=Caerostris extrusa TaxID=172846 RepID=A0AAV4SW37_CAEEX|nr:hypothetical protein CEXT_216121 [Caerostris extrusa]
MLDCVALLWFAYKILKLLPLEIEKEFLQIVGSEIYQVVKMHQAMQKEDILVERHLVYHGHNMRKNVIFHRISQPEHLPFLNKTSFYQDIDFLRRLMNPHNLN